MLGVGGVSDDGGSSPMDSAVVDALQRGEWSPDDPLCCLYHSLQALTVHDSGPAVPRSQCVYMMRLLDYSYSPYLSKGNYPSIYGDE